MDEKFLEGFGPGRHTINTHVELTTAHAEKSTPHESPVFFSELPAAAFRCIRSPIGALHSPCILP